MIPNAPALAMGRRRTLLCAILAVVGVLPAPAAALTQSWNGYRWARTGPLSIGLGNNLTSTWSSLLAPTATAWSAADNIDLFETTGRTSPSSCAAVYGGVQVCNYNYGATGWLGYANVWLSRGFIVQATVKLNDYYFGMARYNTAAWRQQVICQEVGHTLGLAHTNTVMTDTNTGSCMDYTNDPTGLAGTNGTKSNLAPNGVDFSALRGIYANLDTTQLPSTRPTYLAGDGFSIDGEHVHTFAAVPEPGSWTLLIAGFGGIGAMMRRNRRAVASV